MILEYVLPCSPNKNADSVSYGAEQCITQRVTPHMDFVVRPSGPHHPC
jgi:hypothetical protein